jgi:anhydro-N-acetylmuramic acid kinase
LGPTGYYSDMSVRCFARRLTGGQGAPLVPVFHQALARDLGKEHPIAVLNIGGVANVTFVDGGDPIACDTGPGNALIDDFMRARVGAPYDNFGDVAATGTQDFRRQCAQ